MNSNEIIQHNRAFENFITKYRYCSHFFLSHINDGHQLKTSSSADFQNWGLALNSGKVVSRLPPPKTSVISSHCTLPGLRASPQFWQSGQPGTPLGKKTAIWGGKTKKEWTKFFYSLMIPIKNTFCKKNGPKWSIQPSAVTQTFYTQLYGVTTTN